MIEVTVSGTSSCGAAVATATTTVTTELLPTVSITAGGTQSICEDATASITATPVNATATSWAVLSGPGSVNNVANNTTTFTAGGAGTASTSVVEITATSDNSCGAETAVATATVTTDPLPTANTSGVADAICLSGTQTVAGASSANGNVLWTHDGVGSINNATTDAPEYVPAAGDGGNTVTLTMTVTSVNACASATVAATHSIAVDSLPVATLIGNNSVCAGGAVAVGAGQASFLNGSYTWSHDGAGTLSGGGTLVPSYQSTTAEGGSVVTLTLTVMGTANCNTESSTATYPITILDLPTGDISGTAGACQGDPDETITFSSSAGLAPFTYTYTLNGGGPITLLAGNSTVPQPTTTGGTFVYALQSVTDNNGCTSLPYSTTPEATITVSSKPTASIGVSSSTACQNDPAQLILSGNVGSGTFTYTYDDGTGTQTVSSISPGKNAVIGANTTVVGTTTYSLLSVSDDSGCATTYTNTTASITVTALPNATIFGGGTICQDSTGAATEIKVGASGGASPYTVEYKVNGEEANPVSLNPATDSLTINVHTSAAGTFDYTLQKVTDNNGCEQNITGQKATITVVENPLPEFTVNPQSTTILEPTVEIVESSLQTVSWSWDFGDGTTSNSPTPEEHKYLDSGSYAIKLVVENSLGCTDSIVRTVKITTPLLVYIPDAFTPNEDGINDVFLPKGEGIGEYSLKIYDRWGNLIFITDDINKGWDGIANNGTEYAQIDVYVYVVEVVSTESAKTYSYRGTFNLIR